MFLFSGNYSLPVDTELIGTVQLNVDHSMENIFLDLFNFVAKTVKFLLNLNFPLRIVLVIEVFMAHCRSCVNHF